MFHRVVLAIWLSFIEVKAERDCSLFGEITAASDVDQDQHTFIEQRTVNQIAYLQEIELDAEDDKGIRIGLFSESGGVYTAKHLTDWIYMQSGRMLLPLEHMFLTDPADHLGWIMARRTKLKYQEGADVTGVTEQVEFEEGDEISMTTTSNREYSISIKMCADIDLCGSSPCAHFGTCVFAYETSSYTCACISDFHGTNCETSIYEDEVLCSVAADMATPLISGLKYYVGNNEMTASSMYSADYPPSNARLDARLRNSDLYEYWVPSGQSDEWIQVDLTKEFRIRRVGLQGSADGEDGLVTSFRLQFSMDGTVWYSSGKAYGGVPDYYEIVEHPLYEEQLARYVRLMPLTYLDYMSLRFELYGCVEEMTEVMIATEKSIPEVYVDGILVHPSDSEGPVYTFKAPTSTGIEIIAFKLQSNLAVQNGALVHTSQVYSVSGDSGWKCLVTDAEVPVQGYFHWYSKYYDDSSWPDAVPITDPGIALPDNVSDISSIEWIWTGGAEDETTNVYCRGFADPCYKEPCFNNATCVDLEAGFSCTCPAGYEGRLCETDTDECLSQPCVNGLCRDLVDGFECNCVSGYEDQLCDVETDECASQPCVNGTCEDLLNGFHCSCDAGYEGVLCSADMNECTSGPCVFGKCNNLANGFTCSCAPGFEGELCTNETDECMSDPCMNGSCINRLNAFFCACSAGFEDELCSTDTNECLSAPCIHGSCVDRAGGFECVCDAFYEGDLCSEETNNCKSSPCQYGSCTSMLGTYECKCLPGFEGVHCDTESDECQSDPCSTGECIDFLNNYICKCPDGFYKKFC